MIQHHRRTSRPAVAPLFALLAVVAVLALGCQPVAESTAAAATAAAPDQQANHAADVVARGRYLVTVASCGDCHTPWVLGPDGQPMPDATRLLSGHPEEVVLTAPAIAPGPWNWAGAATNTAFAGPWGVSFAANLTPDPSGMGAWDEESFIRALRSGKHWGQSRPILPPMPWPNLAQMTDDDLKAVFAYLQSIPPVSNHVPDPLPPAQSPQPAG